MPLVSVVVPTRNRAPLLRAALQSICAQRDVDLEIIVVDDGSTDETAAVAGLASPCVRVIRSATPLGPGAARNRGVAAARGIWIAFCDDDDLWAPDKLAAQLEAARSAHAAWVYSGDVNIDCRLRVLSGAPPLQPAELVQALRRYNALGSGGSNVLVRTDLLISVGGFDPGLRRTEDWDLWLRLAAAGAPACVRRPHVGYRFHPLNVTADPDRMVAEPQQLARRYDIPVDVAAMHRRAAWSALRAGRRRAAVLAYARAAARGDWPSIARAAFALVHRDVGSDRLFRFLPNDPHWVAEAERWLAVYASAQSDRPMAEAGGFS